MQEPLIAAVYSLLWKKRDGEISGPMGPVEFAYAMSSAMEFKFNRIARVIFNDDEINQVYEGESLTGHDTVIIAAQYDCDLYLTLWIDIGTGGIPIAMTFQSDKEITITPVYQTTPLARRLTPLEIKEVFDYVFEHPGKLGIKNHF